MKNEIKRHLISFGLSFLSTFILTFIPMLNGIDFDTKIWFSLAIASGRSAFKFAYELFIIPLASLLINWAKEYAKKK